MKERDIQDYLYDHPEVLFPSGRITEKAREYSIHGKRIDLLFVVDGVRYIVETKNMPIQRDHIGQVVEYYGLMRHYMQGANLAMVLVSPSIPVWRAAYLEELGIRCVELPTVPTEQERARIQKESRSYAMKARQRMETESVLGVGESVSFEEIAGPVTRKSAAFAQGMLRDSLEPIRKWFSEYDVVPFSITRSDAPTYHVENSPDGERKFAHGGAWWAYRFGFSEDLPKNDVPNVSIMANAAGLDVALDAELLPSQRVMLRRIEESTSVFDRLLSEHGELWLKTFLKYEHQPRFYHWVPADIRSRGEFDGRTIVQLGLAHQRAFPEERRHWIDIIKSENKELTKRQISQLEDHNKHLNMGIMLVQPFPKDALFWSLSSEKQVREIVASVQRMKPLVDFFVK